MFEIRYSHVTGSTNDDAAALLGEPGSAGAVLCADYQRGGKGRRGRAWIAPPGSALLFTAILPEPVATRGLWAVPFWSALGVATGIERATGLRVSLQWPNDLLLDERKCCGILCVSRVVGEHAWVGCGSGINVHRPAHDALFEAIEPPPVFLSDRASVVTRDDVLAAILGAYETSLDALHDPQAIARAWERRASLAGTRYRLLLDGETQSFDGIARHLAPDGSLVVATATGERRVSLAEARVLRDATA